jgi:flavin reductase (DIM6/NTAB) family NADH-FMN oxidoreductase RutF
MTEAFAKIVAELDYPMVIVTAASGDERAGCLVGFSTQCSIHPARYAVFISKRNRTADVAARAPTLIVHVLGPADEGLARVFGEETGDEVSKFDQCSWRAGPADAPILDGCNWFAGDVVQRTDVGDHTLYVLDVRPEGEARVAGQLGFQAVRDLHAGHAP